MYIIKDTTTRSRPIIHCSMYRRACRLVCFKVTCSISYLYLWKSSLHSTNCACVPNLLGFNGGVSKFSLLAVSDWLMLVVFTYELFLGSMRYSLLTKTNISGFFNNLHSTKGLCRLTCFYCNMSHLMRYLFSLLSMSKKQKKLGIALSGWPVHCLLGEDVTCLALFELQQGTIDCVSWPVPPTWHHAWYFLPPWFELLKHTMLTDEVNLLLFMSMAGFDNLTSCLLMSTNMLTCLTCRATFLFQVNLLVPQALAGYLQLVHGSDLADLFSA